MGSLLDTYMTSVQIFQELFHLGMPGYETSLQRFAVSQCLYQDYIFAGICLLESYEKISSSWDLALDSGHDPAFRNLIFTTAQQR